MRGPDGEGGVGEPSREVEEQARQDLFQMLRLQTREQSEVPASSLGETKRLTSSIPGGPALPASLLASRSFSATSAAR